METPVLLGTGFIILAGFIWIFCAYVSYQNAPKFGRSAWTWGILGIIFGPLSLMLLYILPKHEPAAGHGASHAQHEDPQAALYEVPKKKH
jgi:membrane associated rhomboid family serine protease